MKYTVRWFILLCVLFIFPAAGLAKNPFLSSENSRQEQSDSGVRPGDFLPDRILHASGWVLAKIIGWQNLIRQKVAEFAREIRQDPLGPAFWGYLGLAFAYGVIHALGPGHGKVFVGAYFLARKATPGQGVLAGVIIGFLHVLSATVLVLVFYFVIKAGGPGGVDQAGKNLQKISAGMIFLVGIFMAGRSGIHIYRGDKPGDTDEKSAVVNNKSLAALAMAVGLVPCPGAAVLLFFSISLGLLVPGLLAMVFLALGLTVTTTAFGWMALLTRHSLVRKRLRPGRFAGWIYHLPVLAGGIFISLAGAVLFFTP